MQQSLGAYLRHCRQQRNLTQTEFGEGQYSKSYVSAVERGKIQPSHAALRFFAQQLDMPVDTFEQFALQEEQARQTDALAKTSLVAVPTQNDHEVTTLLDLLLEGKERLHVAFSDELAVLPFEAIPTFPLQKQARYAFLKGLAAQGKGDRAAALPALEYALALAPSKHQPAILDALGLNYALDQDYQVALSYHLRAYALLQEQEAPSLDLLLQIELHCAEDYRVLCAYQQASQFYERARAHLQPTHPMQMAAQLYFGLGYCLYASLSAESAFPQMPAARKKPEQVEHTFQHALSLLLQSKALYQVSGDRREEANVGLELAVILLDLCTWRRYVVQQEAMTETASLMNCVSLLDEAEEHCRQVLLRWQDASARTLPAEIETLLYGALASFVRVFGQRAMFARLAGYADTSARERALAVHLCQHMLDAIARPAFPWDLAREAINLSGRAVTHALPGLPRLPDIPSSESPEAPRRLILAEVYFAAGEVAEELGRSATTSEYARDCYTRANHCFQLALKMARLAIPDKERDLGYLVRAYQRCISILEERFHLTADGAEKSSCVLLDLLKEAVFLLQAPACL